MKLTIIGAGKMGEAFARGLIASGMVAPADITLVDIAPHLEELAAALGATAMRENARAVRDAEVIVLAVKPHQVAPVCAEIAGDVPEQAVIISFAAGVTLAQLAVALGRNDLQLARTMPNTPALVGMGAFGLSFGAAVPDDVRRTVYELLSALGMVEAVTEANLDAVTGLSGSGPAFVAMFIEALADGAVQMGLPRAQAQQLAVQTVLGAAYLVRETAQHPAQVKDAIGSPGGTTMAGIAALEETGFRHAVMAAVRAAARRARELSGE